MNHSRVSLRDRIFTWWQVGHKDGMLCMAYGGTMPDGRVRVCDKPRGHFDSHAYEFLDALQGTVTADHSSDE